MKSCKVGRGIYIYPIELIFCKVTRINVLNLWNSSDDLCGMSKWASQNNLCTIHAKKKKKNDPWAYAWSSFHFEEVPWVEVTIQCYLPVFEEPFFSIYIYIFVWESQLKSV